MIHKDDQLALVHIILLYAAIGALLILLLGGCTVTIKQGTAPPVDPLTRKHYPTLEAKP
jgi:hypothetical protein